MSDITEDNFNYEEFSKFAHKMLMKGTCALINCADHLHYEGPTVSNERCRQCFRDRQGL